MTFFHILNFVIPIGSFAFLGYWMDHLCKPDPAPIETFQEKIIE